MMREGYGSRMTETDVDAAVRAHVKALPPGAPVEDPAAIGRAWVEGLAETLEEPVLDKKGVLETLAVRFYRQALTGIAKAFAPNPPPTEAAEIARLYGAESLAFFFHHFQSNEDEALQLLEAIPEWIRQDCQTAAENKAVPNLQPLRNVAAAVGALGGNSRALLNEL